MNGGGSKYDIKKRKLNSLAAGSYQESGFNREIRDANGTNYLGSKKPFKFNPSLFHGNFNQSRYFNLCHDASVHTLCKKLMLSDLFLLPI